MNTALKRAINKYHQRNKEILLKAKDQPCEDCGISYPSYVMHFDHLEGSHKSFNIATGFMRCSPKRLIEEIAKCEVVCANCHAIRTHQRKQK